MYTACFQQTVLPDLLLSERSSLLCATPVWGLLASVRRSGISNLLRMFSVPCSLLRQAYPVGCRPAKQEVPWWCNATSSVQVSFGEDKQQPLLECLADSQGQGNRLLQCDLLVDHTLDGIA